MFLTEVFEDLDEAKKFVSENSLYSQEMLYEQKGTYFGKTQTDERTDTLMLNRIFWFQTKIGASSSVSTMKSLSIVVPSTI